MIGIGPYSFSVSDAERAVHGFDGIWHELGAGRNGSLIEHLRPVFTGDIAADIASAWEAWRAAGPVLRAAGQLPATATGRIDALHVSDGGVPKSPRDMLEITWSGARGDRQHSRRHHGAPYQALCIWSTELISSLAADGHPVAAGAAGENVTVSGLDWQQVRPGVRLRLGAALCEVSSFAVPCKQLVPCFADGRFDRIHADRGPVSRVYATVLEPGEVHLGDAAVLEPPG
ncbi:MAG: MOSC domain-containing protein [Ilumatobacteraceae bacterium]